MKSDKFSSDLLHKYLAGQCSEPERLLVEGWYFNLNKNSDESFSSMEEERLFMRIQTQISEETAPVATFSKMRRVWLYAGAAAAVIILSLSYLIFFTKERFADIAQHSTTESSQVTYSNLLKKVVRYELPDQSVIWLQPGAKLSFSNSFTKSNTREIQFHGEGFFDVKRDEKRPFIIHSGELMTKVLGTSFNIKANENEACFKVSVVSGSVAVSSPNEKNKIETVVLTPKQQAVYRKEQHALVVNTLNETVRTENWQPISLSFNEIPMSDVADRLEHTFQIRILFSNPDLKKCRLKVDFAQQRLPEILEMINTLLSTSYEMDGEKVTLTGEGCK